MGRRAEGRYTFLNRTARPYFVATRDMLEEWFAHLPPEGQSGLRSRFRADNPGQHIAAFWELYLHEVHRRLGYELEYEPELPNTSRKPDFLVHRGDERFYLEGTIVIHSKQELAFERRRGTLLDLVDEAAARALRDMGRLRHRADLGHLGAELMG
jgi:hypothetical protein